MNTQSRQNVEVRVPARGATTASLTRWIRSVSPRMKARIAGVFYVLNIITGGLAVVLAGRGLAGTANLVATACYIVVTVLFYDLFKRVNRNLSVLAALFSLTGCALSVVSTLHIAAVPVNPLAFFGLYCLLIGYLIFHSTFLPRWVGVLMVIASLGWLTFLWPPFAAGLAPYNLAPGILGESVLTLWLLIKGVALPPSNVALTRADSTP